MEPAQFFNQGPGRVAEASLFLPLLERLPEHMREEANEDVRLNALGVDTFIPDPTGFGSYYVWSGSDFGVSTPFRDQFRFKFQWFLPAR